MVKYYLHSLTELYENLKFQQKVYISENCYYKLENGIILYYRAGRLEGMNMTICNIDGLYTIREAPIKLEVGKFYVNREGKKVVCYYKFVHKERGVLYSFMEVGKCENPTRYNVQQSGRFFYAVNKECSRDIIDYWSEENATN